MGTTCIDGSVVSHRCGWTVGSLAAWKARYGKVWLAQWLDDVMKRSGGFREGHMSAFVVVDTHTD